MAVEKVVLYVEMPKSLKDRLTRLSKRRSRKITAEAILAIRHWLAEEEPKEGIEPPAEADDEDE